MWAMTLPSLRREGVFLTDSPGPVTTKVRKRVLCVGTIGKQDGLDRIQRGTALGVHSSGQDGAEGGGSHELHDDD